MRKYWYFFFGILTLKLSSCQEHCVTPDGKDGECIPLSDCSYVFRKISHNMTQDQQTFLRLSKCGYIDKIYYICCERKWNLLPQPPQCGNSLKDRVYGGKMTGLAEYPWLVLLIYRSPRNVIHFVCGGALINDKYILTAAHCISASEISDGWRLAGVRLGEWNITSDPDHFIGKNKNVEEADPHVEIAIENVIVHPNYQNKSGNLINDIALLRLQRKVTFSEFIQPICLPIFTNLRNNLFTDAVADVSGWGATETLRASPVKLKATLNVINLNDCQRFYARFNINLESTQICAGGEKGIDTCLGDSGGPLMIEGRVNNNNFYFMIGLVSFGSNPCGLEGSPGVYTRVGPYLDWIEHTIKL